MEIASIVVLYFQREFNSKMSNGLKFRLKYFLFDLILTIAITSCFYYFSPNIQIFGLKGLVGLWLILPTAIQIFGKFDFKKDV